MAGKFEEVGNFVARGANNVDPRLVDILGKAADATGYQVQAYSGYRPGDSRQHGKGHATDIRIIGPDGKEIPNYQSPEAFSAYETLAQAARAVQQRDYPDLGKQFRWGGYFSGDKGKYGAMDLMHFDLGGSDQLGMAGGSWDKGLTKEQASVWGMQPGIQGGNTSELAFASAPKGNGASAALNAMADGTLKANPVQTVDYVPPPGSGQTPQFTPLVTIPHLQPRDTQEQQQAAPAPAVAPVAQPAPSGGDLMRSWGIQDDGSAPSAPVQQPSAEDQLIKSWGLDQNEAAPAAALTKIEDATPAPDNSTTGDIIRSGASGLARGALDLVGLPGTIQNAFDQSFSKVTGDIASLWGGKGVPAPPPSPLSGAGLRELASKASDGATEYQPQTTAGKYAGTVGEFVPGAALGGGNMLTNVVKYGVVPGVASEAAGQATEGTKFEPYARVGAAIAAPLAAEGVLRGAEAAGNKLLSMTPSGAAANNLTEAAAASGKTVDDVAQDMARNPRLNAMDVDPNLQQMGMNLANQGGAPRSILSNSVESRMAGAKGAVDDAFDEALGSSPDTVKILDDLRAKQQASVIKPEDVRATLDNAMGSAADPQAAINDFITTRSQESAPLYEKALQGGSMAPLEKQFETAFSDATSQVSKAAQDLAAAHQQQLIANAQVSKAGNNVYASSGALEAQRNAKTAVAEAQKALEAATTQKEGMLGRLRQAQEDGTANVPGAVWNPRIQQFLDDPIAKSGLAKGAEIQRLESLAEGKPFNPSEYAITGADAAGNPVVGSVPNMRTLNVVKKGLDRMVEAAKDPTTGRLTEEGRAIDKVRRSFLGELDKANIDYKAARESWAGPSQTMDAFKKGLTIFQNKAGMSGIANTPDAIKAWIKDASPDEVKALKLGARTSLEQEMANSANQVDKVTRIAGVEANRQKLGALIGDDEAKKVIDSLNMHHADPVGDAFSRGLDVLRTRTGSSGLEDRPEFWRQWMGNASDAEKEAAKQGARVAIDSQINAVRSAAAKGASIPEVGFNRDRLEILLGKAETDKLSQVLKDEQRIAQTNNKLFAGSQTAPRQAANKLTEVKQVTPSLSLSAPFVIGGGYQIGGLPGAIAGAGLSLGKMGVQAAQGARDVARNRLMADALSGDVTRFREAVEPAARANRLLAPIRGAQSPLLRASAAVPLNLGVQNANELMRPSKR
jgi:hypothetical protein